MRTPKKHRRAVRCRFWPIVRDPAASRKFYSDTLGLAFKEDANGYLHAGAGWMREAF
jgi:hypothetical protein